jgi:hypothetical protein
MYDTIQSILTYSIEAIAVIGFLSCWLHYCATTTLIEIRSWGTPQSFPHSIITNELKSSVAAHSMSSRDDSPISDTNQPKNQLSTFQDYSKTKLRKIAKDLQIRRYSQMERGELMTAIISHLAAQQACCTH